MSLPRAACVGSLLACALVAVGGCSKGGLEEPSPPDASSFDPPGFEVELPAGWRRPSPAQEARVERQIGDQIDKVAGDEAVVSYDFVGFVPGQRGAYLEVY